MRKQNPTVRDGAVAPAPGARETVAGPPAQACAPQSPPTIAADPIHTEVVPRSDHYAEHLRETVGAAFLYGTMSGLFQQADMTVFKLFRDRLLADAGNPADPIEVMLIEQIALANMNIGRLQFRATTTESIDAAKVYGNMATQLLGEFRRTAVSLQAYRLAARQLATPTGRGPMLVAASAVAADETVPVVETRDSELVKTESSDHADGTVPFAVEEPEADGAVTEALQGASKRKCDPQVAARVGAALVCAMGADLFPRAPSPSAPE